MVKGNYKKIFSVLVLISFVSILPVQVGAQTLAPRLLWQKTLPFQIDDIEMATLSGDVLISSTKAREIILHDKDGNIRFHWGPRIDRQPMGIDISADGDRIGYTTTWTEQYAHKQKKTGWNTRIHYSTRTGKELWNKEIEGVPYLSPDGALVAVAGGHGMGGVPLTVFDSAGNILWKYPTGLRLELRFSPDGNYVIFYDGVLYLFDKSGNLLWKKTDTERPKSISEGATYICTEGQKVYDKQGNLILEGRAEVSGDGKRLLLSYPDKMSMLSLPDKSLIRDYQFWGGFLSYDGRFIGGHAFSRGEVRVFDTLTESWGNISVGSRNFRIRGNTRDGKYLIIGVDGDEKLLFYQVY